MAIENSLGICTMCGRKHDRMTYEGRMARSSCILDRAYCRAGMVAVVFAIPVAIGGMIVVWFI